jgi:hypothetical protein
MTAESPKYDAAISFLYQDKNLAKALYDQLSNGLEVFFFPRNQKELAGSDGLESMREPFRNESRLNVVLYRPGWGKTPWTAVEEAAIKDSCLNTSFKSLFFFVIEPTANLPKWLPETHVRFNYKDFSLEQAVGAIKARAHERGSHIQPLTPTRKAEILEAEEAYRQDKAHLLSSDEAIFKEVEVLFLEVAKQCDDLRDKNHFEIEHRVDTQFGKVEQFCTIGIEHVSMSLTWYQRYTGSLDKAALIIREFDQMIILPPNRYFLEPPKAIDEKQYLPDVSRTREYGWHIARGEESFISNKDLAAQIVMEFLDLVERDRAGKIRRREW